MMKAFMGLAVLGGMLALVGCTQQSTQNTGNEKKDKQVAKSGSPAKEEKKGDVVAKGNAKAGDHSGWWCDEHGVPEDECSLCSSKVAKAAKAKGDWCDKHERAKSICFICDPTLKEKYAAMYRAKFNKEPPPIEVEPAGANDKK